MSGITDEIKKRKNICDHTASRCRKDNVDGKGFLLYGGAINQAGSVKGKATAKHAVSDWMEIEKRKEVSRSLPPCSNSTMMDIASIF